MKRCLFALLAVLLATAGTEVSADTQPLFRTVKSFGTPSPGGQPQGGMIVGLDGFLYGTTGSGGVVGAGTVFKVAPDGSEFTVLLSLDYSTTGGSPVSGLVQGPDGTLYGAAQWGGSSDGGTVFKLGPDGTGFAVLKHMTSETGAFPSSRLVRGADGTLYGSANSGGAGGCGTVFRIGPDGSGFAVLKEFDCAGLGGGLDGGVILGMDGALYGTAYYGGALNCGTVFRVKTDGSDFAVLRDFSGSECGPLGGLVQGPDGSLYGGTVNGGAGGLGTVFRISADGGAFSVLKGNFDASSGFNVNAPLLLGSDAMLYGSTAAGGAASAGTLFRIGLDGSGFAVLKNLEYSTTGQTSNRLVQGPSGTLYGAAAIGGTFGFGTLFSLNADGSGFSVLRHFNDSTDSSDGANPMAGLIQGSDGFLYGTTQGGGAGDQGTAFRVKPDGTQFEVLKRFDYATTGSNPVSELLQGADGLIYGTTPGGGAASGGGPGYGTVFRMNADGTGFSVLKAFAGDSDGGGLASALIQGADGFLYGTTGGGGSTGYGVVFKLATDGTGFQVLADFDNTVRGRSPGALLQGSDGALYGTTPSGGEFGQGTVFRVTRDGTDFVVLKAFDSFFRPNEKLIEIDGELIGTGQGAAVFPYQGTIFSIHLDGSGFTILREIEGTGNGYLVAGLTRGSDGFLYGVRSRGRFVGHGEIFRLRPDGSDLSVVRAFDTPVSGPFADAPLVQGSDGALYGTGQEGGAARLGLVFRLSVSPDSITSVTAAPGDGQATVTFTSPVGDGGSPITGYTATCGAQSQSGAASPITVTGLTNGVPVTCTVHATNAAGDSPESEPSDAATPVASTPCAAGTFSGTGTDHPNACAPASQGYYVPGSGATSETACAPGSYQDLTGQTSCKQASAGYFVASSGASSQTACASGYTSDAGATSCTRIPVSCSAGSFSANGTDEPNACTPASTGHYVAGSGATSETACAPGSYQDLTGQTACKQASAGYFVASGGGSSQTACASGYTSDAGATSCTRIPVSCTAGTFSTNGTDEPNACTPASAGHFVAGSGATSETACAPGSYQDLSGQTSCKLASAGYFVAGGGATSQTACASGYTSTEGATSCTRIPVSCTAGTFSANGTDDPNACTPATPGHYAAGSGATSETACAAGSYQDLTGQPSCKLASADFYVPTSGATSQIACAPGTTSTTGATSCTPVVAATLSVSGGSLTEGNSGTKAMPFTITRNGASAVAVTVNWATAPVSAGPGVVPATAGVDYRSASGTATIPAGPDGTSVTVNVFINGDTLDEDDEKFAFVLSSPSAGELGNDTAIGTIVDDDAAPTVSITGTTVTEGSVPSGTTAANFKVTLSAATSRPVTVHWASSADTAMSDDDFQSASGDLTFLPGGALSQNATVLVNQDAVGEANETFFVTLSAPVNATLGTSIATGQINNDDGNARIRISGGLPTDSTSITVLEGSSTLATVYLSKATAVAITVDWAVTVTGATSSASCADFVGGICPSGTVTIPAGTIEVPLPGVAVIADGLTEAQELFKITLSGALPSGATGAQIERWSLTARIPANNN